MSAEMGPAYFWNALGMNYQQAKCDACYIFFHVIVSSGGLKAWHVLLKRVLAIDDQQQQQRVVVAIC